MQADIKAEAQQAAQWAKNTVAIQAYKDAINGQIAARQQDLDMQIASMGMGDKEAQRMKQMAQLHEQVAQNIERLNRSRGQKGANQGIIDQ